MRLYESVLSGSRRAALDFQENLTRSDFSFLFADVIDRQLLAAYATTPVQWDAVAKRGRVRDFRLVRRGVHEPFLACGSFDQTVAVRTQGGTQEAADVRLIFDYQNERRVL